MDHIFKDYISNQVEVYVDDMVVKSETEGGHVSSLLSVFEVLRKHQLKLNPQMFIQVIDQELSTKKGQWTLLVDGSSNKKGSETKIIIEGPGGVMASNNQAEYEALLAEIRLAKELGVARLTIKSDSQLITRQVGMFEKFTLLHVPCEKNERKDLLAKLTSTYRGGLNRTIIQEVLGQPTVKEQTVLSSEWQPSWFDPIINYLRTNNVPNDLQEGEWEVKKALEEVHERVCGSHIGRRALAIKIARTRFYWPTLKRDSLAFMKKCDKC
ncbi:hypothetical protein CR513_55378, partial [Mucuna pruriens]